MPQLPLVNKLYFIVQLKVVAVKCLKNVTGGDAEFWAEPNSTSEDFFFFFVEEVVTIVAVIRRLSWCIEEAFAKSNAAVHR
ncbi:hypothetical protein JHK85_010725 [Glycine max]|nr:hypothetical protein JHK85_010725 [Glycine max]